MYTETKGIDHTGEIRPVDEGYITTINGIECISWSHGRSDFPANQLPSNSDQIISSFAKIPDAAVSNDGVFTHYALDKVKQAGPNAHQFTFEENVLTEYSRKMWKNLSENKNLLLFGDFVSQFRFREHEADIKQDQVSFWSTISAVSLIETAVVAKLSRRKFLKTLAALPLVATADFYAGLEFHKAWNNESMKDLQSRDPMNLFNILSERFNNTTTADSALRTGLVLAKQKSLIENGNLEYFSPEKSWSHFSIWGRSHFDAAKGDINLIQDIIKDPLPHTIRALKDEVLFLIINSSGMSEIMTQVAALHMNMACIIPTAVRYHSDQKIYSFEYGSDENIFFDKNILGFNPNYLNLRQIENRCINIAQELYFRQLELYEKFKN